MAVMKTRTCPICGKKHLLQECPWRRRPWQRNPFWENVAVGIASGLGLGFGFAGTKEILKRTNVFRANPRDVPSWTSISVVKMPLEDLQYALRQQGFRLYSSYNNEDEAKAAAGYQKRGGQRDVTVISTSPIGYRPFHVLTRERHRARHNPRMGNKRKAVRRS